jgi:hypothetical protein
MFCRNLAHDSEGRYGELCYFECRFTVLLLVSLLSVPLLSDIMLSDIIPSDIVLWDIILSVIMSTAV